MMTFLKDYKGQGAIEYLIIIGGAILIAAVVLSILLVTTNKGKEKANDVFNDFNQIAKVNTTTN